MDVNTANGKDNATIYGVGATYKNGLYNKIIDQCPDLLTTKTYIDNVEHSGDVGEQSWGPHTISASVSFDDSHPTTCPTTRTVHITGLPYNPSNSSTTDFKGDWSFSGGTSEWDDDNSRYRLRDGATATFKGFYIPADVNGTVDYRIEAYVWMKGNDLTNGYVDAETLTVRSFPSTLSLYQIGKHHKLDGTPRMLLQMTGSGQTFHLEQQIYDSILMRRSCRT